MIIDHACSRETNERRARRAPIPEVFPKHHWRHQPQLRTLHRTLDEQISPNWLSVRDAIEAALIDLDWVDEWIGRMSTEALSDPFYEPPLASTSNEFQRGMALFTHRYARIAINILPIDALAHKKCRTRGPASITFTGSVSLQKFLRSGDAYLRMWHAAPADEHFSLAADHRCHQGATRRLRNGELLCLDGRSESYVIEHACSDIVLIQAEILVDRAPLLVEYDSKTRRAVAASSTNDGASRSQMLLSFLAGLGREGDERVVEQFTHEPEFFLRWHAVRELLHMNPERASTRLRAMALDDPHPELRATASTVLGLIGGHECHVI